MTRNAISLRGHCAAHRNGCGKPTPFSVMYRGGDLEYLCAVHLAPTLRQRPDNTSVTVTTYDPPLKKES